MLIRLRGGSRRARDGTSYLWWYQQAAPESRRMTVDWIVKCNKNISSHGTG